MNINPITWPLAAKFAGVGAIAAVIAGTGAAAVIKTTSAEPGVTTYLCYNGATGGNALLMQWTAQGNVLSGTYQQASASGSSSSETVSTNSGDLSGQLNGSGVTVDLGGGQQWYGKITGSALVANVPQPDGTIQPLTCKQSAVTSWNSAIAQLNQRVNADNTAANQQAQQQAQQAAQQEQQAQQQQDVGDTQSALTTDVATLAADASTLDTDTSLAAAVQQMSNDLSSEQSAWQSEQSDSCPNDDGDAGTVSADADSVDADQQGVQEAVSELQSGDIASVDSDMSAVDKDLAALKALGASPATDSSTATAAGTKALSDSQSAITWANQHAQSIDGQADQTAQDASDYASGQSC